MKNVATKVEGNMLWIGVNLDDKQGPTKSGKAITVADTEGYRNVPGTIKHGFKLHVYERQEKKAS